ncbi:MAG: type II secretion system F family protein [Vulcanimicrobiota bacterium]
MPVFTYEAVDSKGHLIKGEMEAPNVEAIIDELREIQYTVTDINEKKDFLVSINNFIMKFQGVGLYALAIFTRQFATVYNAGIPVVRGLKGLARQSINRKLSQVVQQIYSDIKSGYSLTRALQKHPKVFTPVYIAMVRAGEMSGALAEILERLAILLERDYNLRKKVQSSMTYPIIIFIVAVLLIFILVTYIFPQFVSMLEGMNTELPWPTVFLIYVTNAISSPYVLGLIAIVMGIMYVLFKQYFSTPMGRRQLDRFLLEIPFIGNVNQKVALSRFCRTLGVLLASGVPLIHSLEVVGKVAGNEVIADVVDEIKLSLKGGRSLSYPLEKYPEIFPPMMIQMVSVGEETGSLPYGLEKLSSFYESEVDVALEAFITVIEPIMILVMGGVVGFVMLAVFLPVYTLLRQF